MVNRLLELKGRVDILATDDDGDNAFMGACIGKSKQSIIKSYFRYSSLYQISKSKLITKHIVMEFK